VPKKRLQQIFLFFSFLFLLILPTAIVGYENFGDLRNIAFGKRFLQEEGLYTVSTESSTNIAKDSPFVVNTELSSPSALILNYFAAVVEYDPAKVSISSIDLEENTGLKVIQSEGLFIILPNGNHTPDEIEDLLPEKCYEDKTCDFVSFQKNLVRLKINGLLKDELTDQQRPIKITYIAASESASSFFWNRKTVSPELKLGSFVRNAVPEFLSEPTLYISESEKYSYKVTTKDFDNDQVSLSLACPNNIVCTQEDPAPEGMVIVGNELQWESPKARKEPYIVSIYADDGKSVSTQTFSLKVLRPEERNFACTFTIGYAVKVVDYKKVTPLILDAQLSSGISKVEISLAKENTIEKTFSYMFPDNPQSIILDDNATPPLSYKFNEGTYNGEAIITDISGNKYSCELVNNYGDNSITTTPVTAAVTDFLDSIVQSVYAAASIVVGDNRAPTFSTNPYTQSQPGVSFVTNTSYSYVLTAQDQDGDPLSYTKVTAPSWANVSVLQNTGGTLSLQITGVPTTGGSNLFSYTINDGNGSFITQTWVVNVDFPDNDIPRVTIKQPTTGITRVQGQSFLLEWDAQDRNQIVKFELFYTRQLGGTLTTFNNNIGFRVRSMTVGTGNIPPGDYYFVLKAHDNRNPAGIGQAVTQLVRILPKPQPTATVAPTPTQTVAPTPSPTQAPTPTGTITPTPSPTMTPSPTATPTPTPTPSVSISPTPTEEIPTPTPELVFISITDPTEGAKLASNKFKVVARIEASQNATLQSRNITVLVNSQEVTDSVTYSAEEGKTLTFTYQPRSLLPKGSHSITIKAQDSAGKTGEKKVSFSITDLTTSDTGEETTDFLGFKIPTGIRNVFLVGIVILVLALLLPILLYMTWSRGSKKTVVQTTVQPAPTLKPASPTVFPSSNAGMPRVASPAPVAPNMPQAAPVQSPQAQRMSTYSPENAGLTTMAQKPATNAAQTSQAPVQSSPQIPRSSNIPNFIQPKPMSAPASQPMQPQVAKPATSQATFAPSQQTGASIQQRPQIPAPQSVAGNMQKPDMMVSGTPRPQTMTPPQQSPVIQPSAPQIPQAMPTQPQTSMQPPRPQMPAPQSVVGNMQKPLEQGAQQRPVPSIPAQKPATVAPVLVGQMMQQRPQMPTPQAQQMVPPKVPSIQNQPMPQPVKPQGPATVPQNVPAEGDKTLTQNQNLPPKSPVTIT
jgi:hypothetical protein